MAVWALPHADTHLLYHQHTTHNVPNLKPQRFQGACCHGFAATKWNTTTAWNRKRGLNQQNFKLTLACAFPFLILTITKEIQMNFRHSLLTVKENGVEIQHLSKLLAKKSKSFFLKKNPNDWAARHGLFSIFGCIFSICNIQQGSALFLGSSQDHQCGCRYQLFSNREGWTD